MKRSLWFALLVIGCTSTQLRPRDDADYGKLARDLSSIHDRYRVAAIASRTFKPADYWNTVQPLTGSNVRREEIGKSAQGRPLYLLTYGHGPVKILLWSQMHGDESTASMSLADFVHYLNAGDERTRGWADHITIYMVPVLNPDGAELFQRENALGIDINRDARMQATPEGRALKSLRDRLQPHFGFNLHDQNVRTRVGNTDRLAAISLLAPPPDAQGSINDVRRRAMHVAALIRNSVEPLVPGHITKYDESFNPRAFGDLMQQWGTSTVLIESGGWRDDPEKQHLRKANFVALVSALDAIANDTYRNTDVVAYTSLPSNGRAVRDLVIRGGTIVIPGLAPYRADIAVDVQPSFEGSREGRVVEVGDLAEVLARDTVNATGLYVHAAPTVVTAGVAGPYLRTGAPSVFKLTATADTAGRAILSIDGITVTPLR